MKKNRILLSSISLLIILLVVRWWVGFQFTSKQLNEKFVGNLIEDQVFDQEYRMAQVLDSLSLYGSVRKDGAVKTPYPYFVYQNDSLTYWSDFHFVPSFDDLKGTYQYRFLEKPQGKFILRKWVVVHQKVTYEVFATIPLYSNYLINNLFIQSEVNPAIAPPGLVEIDSPTGQGYKVEINKVPVCTLRLASGYSPAIRGPIQLIDGLLLLFLIVFYVSGYKWLATQNRFFEIPALLVGWMGFKLLLPLLSGISTIFSINLFDPQYYAVSWFERSFGDLIINSAFILLVSIRSVVWFKSRRLAHWLNAENDSGTRKFIFSILLSFISFWVLNYLFFQLRSVYHNSQISIDITQSLQMGYLRFLTFVIVVIINISTFFFYHTLLRHLVRMVSSAKLFAAGLSIGALLFIVLSFFANMPIANLAIINILLATGLWYFKLPKSLSTATYRRFLYIVIFLGVLSLLYGQMISEFEKQRKVAGINSLLEKKLAVSDPFAEFLLSSALSDLSSDPFIVNRMASPFLSKTAVESKVKQVFLNSYLNKFEQLVLIFDSKGKPLGNARENRTLFELLDNLSLESAKTDYPSVLLVGKTFPGFTKHYVGYATVKRSNNLVGYVLVELIEKQFGAPGVYPELLVDNRFQSSSVLDIDFAYYQDGKLLNTVSTSEYPASFNFRDRSVWLENGRIFVAMSEGRRAIIAGSPFNERKLLISNASFIWVITLLPLVLIWLVGFSVRKGTIRSLSYTERILWYLNLAFIIPLVVVTSVTFRLLTESFERESNSSKLATVGRVADQLNPSVLAYVQNIESEEKLVEQLNTLSDNTQSDFNLFNTSGRLIASSQPAVFNKFLLAPYINPEALNLIKEEGKSHTVLKEQVGGLFFNDSYAAVVEESSGKLLGIVGMPFFSSDSSLQSSKLEAFTTILNVFVVVLFATLMVTYFAGKWLTKPLVVIRNKLRSTSFSKQTEPITIQWTDELGMLIRAYNEMLADLEESKGALQRTEKEKAWREAAQQVAHEIKNPLTPMKLTLQRLYNKLQKGQTADTDLETPLKSVLDQVETLNSIASSFSEFAKMPTPSVERVEMHAIIQKASELFSGDSGLKIKLQLQENSVYSEVDPKLMSRILNNLLLNAKQSAKPEQQCVEVTIQTNSDKTLLIIVKDDGAGIDPAIADRVFIPKFTTKEHGSGIGLAMTKYGVENMGGKIYFESEVNTGTTFTLELPIID
ncbi:MAG: hypothetical protein KDC79_03900 [Cyclobacteriaceae bacterium]|nr:hypothetical protein [Cyclobacteriaceae bacterium]